MMESVLTAKQRARRLRSALAAKGLIISHGEALELLAQSEGLRDWNTLSARLQRPGPAWRP